jgi:RNA polymerase sigma factor (sigma-70 family)
MQDARLAALQALPSFENRGEEGLILWMAKIAELKAKETVRNHARAKRAFRREVTRGHRVDTANFLGRELSPSNVAMSAERNETVRDAMEMLPDDYREVLSLVFEQHLTLGEAGQRMGRSREAMKKLHGRALCRFKEVFQQLQEGGHD